MKGSIVGDIVGSAYEFNSTKDYNFELFTKQMDFTDDSVLTCAVIDSILNYIPFDEAIYSWGNRYPGRGYGGRFNQWLSENNPKPYNSYGNGSAMRVSPIGFIFESMDQVLDYAKRSAEVTHNHIEGIKGAQAVALAIHLAKKGSDKSKIKREIESTFGYNLSVSYYKIHSEHRFDETCQGSVPESFIAFFESTDFESAIRLAVSLGGDADTQACIAGGIAEAYYKKIPQKFIDHCLSMLPMEMTILLERLYEEHSLN